MPILRSLFILLAAATFAFGEDFTPENAATFALRHNKDLIAARHLIAEAEGRPVQAGLWNNPEFELRTDLDLRQSDGDRIYGGGFRRHRLVLTVFESRKQRLAIEQAAIDTEEKLATAITDWETRAAYFPATVRAALDSEGRRVPKASAAKRLIPTRTDSRNSRP